MQSTFFKRSIALTILQNQCLFQDIQLTVFGVLSKLLLVMYTVNCYMYYFRICALKSQYMCCCCPVWVHFVIELATLSFLKFDTSFCYNIDAPKCDKILFRDGVTDIPWFSSTFRKNAFSVRRYVQKQSSDLTFLKVTDR